MAESKYIQKKPTSKVGPTPGQKIKKSMEDKVDDAITENIFSKFRMRNRLAEKKFKDIPSGMKKDPKNRSEIINKLLYANRKDPAKELGDSRREVFAANKMAKGGRAGFKSGSKGCKLAKRGKGRAYGKNS